MTSTPFCTYLILVNASVSDYRLFSIMFTPQRGCCCHRLLPNKSESKTRSLFLVFVTLCAYKSFCEHAAPQLVMLAGHGITMSGGGDRCMDSRVAVDRIWRHRTNPNIQF